MLFGNPVVLTPPSGDSSDRVATTGFVGGATGTQLTTGGGQTITGGFTWTPFSLGTVTTGTVTPSALNNLKQTLINGGSFTLAAPTVVGDVELYITNNASAGTITFSGFTKQFTSDALDTTNGHEFVIYIYCFKNDAGTVKTAYLSKAMQ